MVSDDPAKGLGLAAPEALVSQKLKDIIGESTTEVDLVSAYFVPAAAGVEAFVALAEHGVNIGVLKFVGGHGCGPRSGRVCEAAQTFARGRHYPVRNAAFVTGDR